LSASFFLQPSVPAAISDVKRTAAEEIEKIERL
jgi:hypothetical protein